MKQNKKNGTYGAHKKRVQNLETRGALPPTILYYSTPEKKNDIICYRRRIGSEIRCGDATSSSLEKQCQRRHTAVPDFFDEPSTLTAERSRQAMYHVLEKKRPGKAATEETPAQRKNQIPTHANTPTPTGNQATTHVTVVRGSREKGREHRQQTWIEFW